MKDLFISKNVIVLLINCFTLKGESGDGGSNGKPGPAGPAVCNMLT